MFPRWPWLLTWKLQLLPAHLGAGQTGGFLAALQKLASTSVTEGSSRVCCKGFVRG